VTAVGNLIVGAEYPGLQILDVMKSKFEQVGLSRVKNGLTETLGSVSKSSSISSLPIALASKGPVLTRISPFSWDQGAWSDGYVVSSCTTRCKKIDLEAHHKPCGVHNSWFETRRFSPSPG
jgi:hypothetical protein